MYFKSTLNLLYLENEYIFVKHFEKHWLKRTK